MAGTDRCARVEDVGIERFRGGRWSAGLFTVLVTRLSRRSFRSRRHPYTSLREYVCQGRQPLGTGEARHRIVFATVSRCKASQSAGRSAREAESKWHLRLRCRRGPLPVGRADATAIIPPGVLGLVRRAGLARRPFRNHRYSGNQPLQFPFLWNGERVGGPGGGDSSPWSPAGGRRKLRTDAPGRFRHRAAPVGLLQAAHLLRGGPPITYAS